jgi:hypothetical protein
MLKVSEAHLSLHRPLQEIVWIDILDGPANNSCFNSDARGVDDRAFVRLKRDRPSMMSVPCSLIGSVCMVMEMLASVSTRS